VKVVVHRHVRVKLIPLPIKMLKRASHQFPFARIELRLSPSKAPSDEIDHIVIAPMREPSSVNLLHLTSGLWLPGSFKITPLEHYFHFVREATGRGRTYRSEHLARRVDVLSPQGGFFVVIDPAIHSRSRAARQSW
jgi:hypothetical protein